MCDIFTRSGNITLQFDVVAILKLESWSSSHGQVFLQQFLNIGGNWLYLQLPLIMSQNRLDDI